MNKNRYPTPAGRLLALCLSAGAMGPAFAQSAVAPLRFQSYLDAVEAHSLDLAAQRETITAARAGVGIAGIRPDPELSYSTSREQVRTISPRPLSHGPSLSLAIETGGKRNARIKAAKSTVALAEANVEGFKHQLYSDAASAFAQACRSREALARKEQTLQALSEVVRVNEVRRKAGDVAGLELLQSRVERDQFQAEVAQARAEVAAARLALAVPLGRRLDGLFGPAALDCAFAPFPHGEDIEALVTEALRARDDILIARAALENARDNASLARANRWVDPTVSVGVTATRGYRGGSDASGEPFEGTARSRVLTVSLSVPIPFSRLDRGDLVQAESAVTQAMLGLGQAELKAEAEARAAHQHFSAARENVARYRDGVLADAQQVLEGIRLSYRNGAASLLELLAAQRSADDAYLAYLQAESDLAAATVQLQLSVGLRPAL